MFNLKQIMSTHTIECSFRNYYYTIFGTLKLIMNLLVPLCSKRMCVCRYLNWIE